MKFGLFLALLVIFASTNVFGQHGGKTKFRKDRTSQVKTGEFEADQDHDGVHEKSQLNTGKFDHNAKDTNGTHVNVNIKLGEQGGNLPTEDRDTVPQNVKVSVQGSNPHTEDHDTVPQNVKVSVQGSNLHTEDHDTVPQNIKVSVQGSNPHTEDHDTVPQNVKVSVQGSNLHTEDHDTVPQNIKVSVQGGNLHTEDHDTVPQNVKVSVQGSNIHTEDHDAVPENVNINLQGSNPHTEDHDAVPENVNINLQGSNSHTEGHDAVPENVNINLEGNNPHTEDHDAVPENVNINLEGNNPHTEDDDAAPENVNINLQGNNPHTEDHDTVPENVNINLQGSNPHIEDHDTVPQNRKVSVQGGNIPTEDHDTLPQNGTVSVQGGNIPTEDHDTVPEDVKPGMIVGDHSPQTPIIEPHSHQEEVEGEHMVADGIKDKEPAPVVSQLSENSVHVSGNIVLVKYHSTVVDSVQYDIDGSRLTNGDQTTLQTRLPFAQDFISRHSRVTLFVSTSKTTDPKLAFAKFPIKFKEDHFPLSFDIDVELPDQQRGLLERADITLYFFVYINNLETRIDTFLPAGTSQILLQGTNRLVQKLDVFVRASGIEVSGLFRGRFGFRYIRPGTSFQVFIVPEQSLMLRDSPIFESVAQLTLTNVPAMYPVPFSLLVHNQMLKPNTKYYAIAFVFENGIRRPLNQAPIWVINEQKILVTSQVIFVVIPSPFILRGTVTRSMPGSFFLQPNSSLILRLHEIDSTDSRDIIFKLPEILTLPQVFQVNISQALRFDPSKNYDMRALITDERNNIYMASLQAIPLLDEFSRLIIPVDDLLYYVQAHLHSSSNLPLNYIPNSTAQIFVTETPETPSKPIVSMRIDSITQDFREFSIQVPATAIQLGRNYYLVMMIEINGIITHISKSLLISNNQPPPMVIQLPVLSLNLITGVIFDVDNRPPQWSSSSYANLFLLDDKSDNPEKAIVQVWKIHLEDNFPVRFEVQLDFSRLHSDRIYRLQGAIENGRNLLEYKPAGSVLALNPTNGIITDVRIPVINVKTFQLVNGLIYINDIHEPLPEKSEIIVQLSSSPSVLNPSIIDEIHIKVEGRSLPVDFQMKLPLNKIDINSVYYFLIRYVVRDNILIPSSQAFAFSPRNEATVVLTLSKTPQIPITGQITSTGNPLMLPSGSTLHLYITDNFDHDKPIIYSEVFLQASSNSLYEFTMNIDSLILQKKIPLYLRADILYQDKIILSIPRPALLQISPGGEWNINLVIDLPTLLIGRIVSMSQQAAIGGEFDVQIQIFEHGTTNIVQVSRLRLAANLPQEFRIELDNELFIRYPSLQARAVIKNCKEQVLFESGGTVNIHTGLNVKVDLPVILTDPKKFTELQTTVNDFAPLQTGVWRLSVTGVVSDVKNGLVFPTDNIPVVQK